MKFTKLNIGDVVATIGTKVFRKLTTERDIKYGNFLTFSGPSAFTLKTYNSEKNWDGVLQYSTNASNWSEWDGTTISADSGVLYVRGTGNTKITGGTSSARWLLNEANIACDGNIENLLDYATVASGKHPAMSYGCYSEMFYNCTSLTTVPELPATTLAKNCYYFMFSDCKAIKLSATKTGEYQTPYRIPTRGTGTTATDALAYMFGNTGGTFRFTPSINTTYYTSNTVV